MPFEMAQSSMFENGPFLDVEPPQTTKSGSSKTSSCRKIRRARKTVLQPLEEEVEKHDALQALADEDFGKVD